jgi:4-oxalocrotonate tautomerase
MPTVRVEMFEGRDREVKQKLATEITQLMIKTVGCTQDSVQVVFTDISKENWAMGGELAVTKFPD